MYRDASNYKECETVIVAGEVSRDELLHFCSTENGDDNGFIPSQVGLEDLQPRMINFPSDDDHVWHELLEVTPTEMEPSIKMTAVELLLKFRAANDNWDVPAAVDRLGLI